MAGLENRALRDTALSRKDSLVWPSVLELMPLQASTSSSLKLCPLQTGQDFILIILLWSSLSRYSLGSGLRPFRSSLKLNLIASVMKN